MEYSKISSVEITNFMSFKKAKISFDETGIINIKGYNDAGKSAILRAIAVCLMDMFKHKQAKFIRHGEEYFRIVVNFDDGVSILRDKYLNGQSLYEAYKNEELLFTTKQGNRLSRIEGVPKPIQEYLGLCITDSTYLNYQSCVDRLPVVDTSGSENYQMFHEVLRMEEIYRASNMINLDKNEVGNQIKMIEIELERDQVLLERCGDVSQEFIDEIEKLEKESVKTNSKQEKLNSIADIVVRYDSIVELPKIEKIPTDRLSKVYSIGSIIKTIDSKKEIPSVKKVSVERLSSLYSIGKRIKELEGYMVIPEIPRVDENLIAKRNKLNSIVKKYRVLVDREKDCNVIDNKLNEAKNKLNELVELAKQKGIEFTKCDNCGCYTVVGGGHTHE